MNDETGVPRVNAEVLRATAFQVEVEVHGHDQVRTRLPGCLFNTCLLKI